MHQPLLHLEPTSHMEKPLLNPAVFALANIFSLPVITFIFVFGPPEVLGGLRVEARFCAVTCYSVATGPWRFCSRICDGVLVCVECLLVSVGVGKVGGTWLFLIDFAPLPHLQRLPPVRLTKRR